MPDYSQFNQAFDAFKKALSDTEQRAWLTLKGEQPWAWKQLKNLLDDDANALVLSDYAHPFTHSQTHSQSHIHQFLGNEYPMVIFDGFSGIHPDKLAACLGSIQAGGMLIFICPPDLTQFDDPALARFISEGESASQSHFNHRLSNLLSEHQQAYLTQTGEYHFPEVPALPHTRQQAINAQGECLTAMFAEIKAHTHTKHTLIADRGRGKSALLGMLSNQCQQAGLKVAMCALQARSIESVKRHLAPDVTLNWGTPEQFLHSQTSLPDVLLIDEAATIAMDTLLQLAERVPHCVFATTVHGYEGSGQSFALRFCKALEANHPHVHHRTLHLPIRFNQGCMLEELGHTLFLLDAEPSSISTAEQLTFEEVSQAMLAKDEALLNRVFALLVSAHYQTSVNDLRHLLDGAPVSIWLAKNTDHVVAVLLVQYEGEIASPCYAGIKANVRRLKGHLFPQSMLQVTGDVAVLKSRYARIVRVAVHPELQRRGIASKLISHFEQHIETNKLADFICTSFGATDELTQFWQSLSFTPLKFGFKRDAASGSFALMMAKPINPTYETVFTKLSAAFQFTLPHFKALHLAPLSDSLYDRVALKHSEPTESELVTQCQRFLDKEIDAEAARPYAAALLQGKALSGLLADYINTTLSPSQLISRHACHGKRAYQTELRAQLSKSLC